MIPLRDSIPSETTPFVNYIMIGICAVMFMLQVTASDSGQTIIEQYGMIPSRVTDPSAPAIIQEQVLVRTRNGTQAMTVEREIAASPIAPILTLISCMFLHGGWMHFLGNMWFLYIFGDNVEDRLGHFGFTLLYLLTGVLAGLSHLLSSPSSPIPTIGASGAIAGVMGAYMFLYPHARVLAIIPLVVILQTIVLPAPVFLGIWFLMQTFQGVASISDAASTGVAWWAHIGGFVCGALFAMFIGRTPLGKGPVAAHRF